MMRSILLAGAVGALACSCYASTSTSGPPAATTYVEPSRAVPAGTMISAVIDATPAAGDTVQAHTDADIRSSDNAEVLIPMGSVLTGHILSGRDGQLQVLRFDTIVMGGATQPIDADVIGMEGGPVNLMPGQPVQIRLAQPLTTMAQSQPARLY